MSKIDELKKLYSILIQIKPTRKNDKRRIKMATNMTDKIYLKQEFIKEELLRTFNNKTADTIFSKNFTNLENKIKTIIEQIYIPMQNELVYSTQVVGCWRYLFAKSSKDSFRIESGYDVNDFTDDIKKYFGNYDFSIPTHSELKDLIYKSSAPWIVGSNKKPKVFCDNRVVSDFKGTTMGKYTDYDNDQGYGYVYPIYRLNGRNSKKLSNIQTLNLWLKHKLKPTILNDKFYDALLKLEFVLKNTKLVAIKGDLSSLGEFIEKEFYTEYFKSKDYKRANIIKYDDKMFYDANKGSWELYANINQKQDKNNKNNNNTIAIKLPTPLCTRNPKADIVDGIIGIDFGTKSTVVVYSKDKEKILPMRVGVGDWSKQNQISHYENPTIMEFNNLEKFLNEYNKNTPRPNTSWNDLTISHTAYENLKSSKSDNFNAYLTELKQWAGDKKRKLKIRSKQSSDIHELNSFLDIKDTDINPIEIYAYYLGLYINNQYNGIYLDYILSFPVTYEQSVRQKILDSFKKGIKKSLPILDNEVLENLSVKSGVSEPAAYAAIAMQNYGFEDKERSFYAIFDFGGGTTDFDYGIFRYSDDENKKERRYDYVIEHFGAGGDKFLGGENILELLAFNIFKANKDELLKNKISFVLPPECDEFLGSEVLLNDSREAKLNMVNMTTQLRKFWEREDFKDEVFKGKLNIDLYDNKGELISQCALKVDEKKLLEILKNRIQKGVDAFFESLREVFTNYSDDIQLDDNTVNIFLAGNSCKSPIVNEIFDSKIKSEIENIEQSKYEVKFELFAPLDNKDNFEKPNGKTGVAYGLIETRPGGRILVVDKNIKDNEIKFKYYLGINKRKKFKVIVNREIEYNKWIEFIDASEEYFEVYYTSIASATTNSLAIDDSSIKRKRLKIKNINDDFSVYIRLISPTEFEYGVGLENDIKDIIKVELN